MRKKLLMAAGIFLALIVVTIVALSMVVKTYLQSEKLKQIIIPRAEEYTGRKVALDRIDVSLFKGIVLRELVISEKEGDRDFVRVKEFVLAYDLLPLLKKQLVIRKLVFVSPEVRVKRFRDGTYNFSDIAAKASAGEEGAKGAKNEEGGGGLPVSLVTERVLLEDAKVEFTDETKNLPDVSVRADADFKVSLEKELRAEGRLDLKELSAELKGVKTTAKGRLDIKKDTIEANIETSVDGEQINIEATARDYATSPDITFSVKAGEVDAEKLMALAGEPGKEVGKPEEKKPEAGGKPEEAKPMDVKASGTVDVKSARYKEFTVADLHFQADARLSFSSAPTGTVDIKEFKATVNGIAVNGGGTVKLEPESVEATLKASANQTGPFAYREYTIEGLKLEASPDVTYLPKEDKVKAHVPVRELTAASLSTKDTAVKSLRFSGVADATYGLESERVSAIVKMDNFGANLKGADVAAKGTVSYDGETLSAVLVGARATAETYANADYSIKNLRLAADTDLKVRLKDKAIAGTAVLKELKANVNGVAAGATGKLSATEKKIAADLTATIDKEEIKLSATASDYRDAPDINFDIYSKRLDIDRLMALTETKKAEGAPEKPAPEKKPAKSDEKPLKVKAAGSVKIDKAGYKEYSINNFSANIRYVDEVVTVDPVSMLLEGGAAMAVDGNFKGNVSFKYPRGSAEASDVMKRTMSGKGSSKFTKIQINDVKVANSIARLTGLEELSNPTFTDSQFNYAIKDQKVNLDGYMNSSRVKFTALGFVGLDKALNMEADLWLDNVLTRRLIVTKVIRERDGSSTLPLVIKGTADDPKVNINTEKVIKKEMDKGIQKLFDKVVPQKQEQQEPTAPQEQPPAEEKPAPEPIKEIFKGIFGK